MFVSSVDVESVVGCDSVLFAFISVIFEFIHLPSFMAPAIGAPTV